MAVVVRATGDTSQLGSLVRGEVRALDRNVPVEQLKPMNDVLSESLAKRRIVATLVGGFALFALALAAIGLDGVVAYSVSQRHHETGVRMALGAAPGTVAGTIVRRGAVLAATRLAIGMPLAFGPSGWLPRSSTASAPTMSSSSPRCRSYCSGVPARQIPARTSGREARPAGRTADGVADSQRPAARLTAELQSAFR